MRQIETIKKGFKDRGNKDANSEIENNTIDA